MFALQTFFLITDIAAYCIVPIICPCVDSISSANSVRASKLKPFFLITGSAAAYRSHAMLLGASYKLDISSKPVEATYLIRRTVYLAITHLKELTCRTLHRTIRAISKNYRSNRASVLLRQQVDLLCWHHSNCLFVCFGKLKMNEHVWRRGLSKI